MEKMLEMRDKIRDKSMYASILSNLGVIAKQQGDFIKAKNYYLESLGLLQEIGYQAGVGVVLQDLGLNSIEQGYYTEAVDYLAQSLEIFLKVGKKINGLICLAGLGCAFAFLGQGKASVKILGAVKIQEEQLDSQMKKFVEMLISRGISYSRTLISEEDYIQADMEGAAMDYEEIIDYTLTVCRTRNATGIGSDSIIETRNG